MVYPCHGLIVSMQINNGNQRFFIGHTDKVCIFLFFIVPITCMLFLPNFQASAKFLQIPVMWRVCPSVSLSATVSTNFFRFIGMHNKLHVGDYSLIEFTFNLCRTYMTLIFSRSIHLLVIAIHSTFSLYGSKQNFLKKSKKIQKG